MSYLVLTEIIHFATAALLFVIFSILFGPLTASLSFLGAFFIDVDHVFDYFLYTLKYKKQFNVKEFLKAKFFKETGKIFLPLHSWELSLLLIGIYFSNFNPIFLVLGSSIFVHLTVDQLTNNVKSLAYFLAWRVIKSFNINSICNKK